MQFLLDHLLAVIVGGVTMLIVATMMHYNAVSNVESQKYYTMRLQTNALIEIVRADFVNIGSGVEDPAATPMIAEVVQDSGNTVQFSFRADVDSTSAGVEHLRYVLTKTGEDCQIGNGNVKPCRILRRYACTADFADCSQEEGRSSPTITFFSVEMLDSAGDATVVPAQARLMRVRLNAISPSGENNIVPEARWQSLFRPVNLTRQ